MPRMISVVLMAAAPILAGSASLAQTAALADPASGRAPDMASDPGEQEMIVTGVRESDSESSPPTGSRIARGDGGIGFQTIATNTGVAGLTPGSGLDPFAGGTRYRPVTECRADHASLSPAIACRFVGIQALLANGAHDAARTEIHRLLESGLMSDQERYLTAMIWYEAGQVFRDDMDRQDALLTMLSTRAMPQHERAPALRTLVSISLRENDRQGAIGLLEQLVTIAPSDTRSKANLAALYAGSGRAAEAEELMRQAIGTTESRGDVVPSDWRSFVDDNRTPQ